MVQVGDVIVSADCLTEKFCCDLEACHGVCCIEGDAGAPLTLDELGQIEEALPAVWPDLSASAQHVIDKQGVAYTDAEGDLVTSIVHGKDCVFTCYDASGCCFCALDKAYRGGRTHFRKPMSCYLYPIRVKRIGNLVGLNYHRWDVCKAAVRKGEQENLPVYRFLKEPLENCFGKEWYEELETVVRELKAQNYL